MEIWQLLAIGLVAIVGLSVYASWSQSREAELETERKRVARIRIRDLASRVLYTSRGDYIRGKRISKELGWIKVYEAKDTEDFELQMKAACAERGGNAVIKMNWHKKTEEYVAGHGPKGNPYYRNRTSFWGEGVAVIVA